MTDLPYTHTDVNGTRLIIGYGFLGLEDGGTGPIYLHLPTGDDAAALARAVLHSARTLTDPAALDAAGHVVIDRADLPDTRSTAYRAAMSMRTRAAAIVQRGWPHVGDPGTPADQCHQVTRAVRALPLLPDGADPDDDPRFPARGSDVITDIAHALATPGELSATNRTFYETVLDRFVVLTAERDRARADVDEAWEAVAQYDSEMASLRREASELRQALRSAISSPDEAMVHTTLSHMRKLAEAEAHTEDLDPDPCAARSPSPVAHGFPYECERAAGHEGSHHALRGSVTWDREEADRG